MVQLTHSDIITQKIKELVSFKIAQSKKEWIPGRDYVQYAGSYFDDEEFIAGIECFLDGWLA